MLPTYDYEVFYISAGNMFYEHNDAYPIEEIGQRGWEIVAALPLVEAEQRNQPVAVTKLICKRPTPQLPLATPKRGRKRQDNRWATVHVDVSFDGVKDLIILLYCIQQAQRELFNAPPSEDANAVKLQERVQPELVLLGTAILAHIARAVPNYLVSTRSHVYEFIASLAVSQYGLVIDTYGFGDKKLLALAQEQEEEIKNGD